MSLLKIILGVCIFAVLTACGTSVKLDDAAASREQLNNSIAEVSTDDSLLNESNIEVDTETMKKLIAANFIIYFDFDSYSVKPENQVDLSKHANFLKNNPGYSVILEGHTDQQGGSEYNLALGQSRSQAVQNYLSILGVPLAKMESISYGKEKPAVEYFTEEAFAKNRRVEIRYLRAK